MSTWMHTSISCPSMQVYIQKIDTQTRILGFLTAFDTWATKLGTSKHSFSVAEGMYEFQNTALDQNCHGWPSLLLWWLQKMHLHYLLVIYWWKKQPLLLSATLFFFCSGRKFTICWFWFVTSYHPWMQKEIQHSTGIQLVWCITKWYSLLHDSNHKDPLILCYINQFIL